MGQISNVQGFRYHFSSKLICDLCMYPPKNDINVGLEMKIEKKIILYFYFAYNYKILGISKV